MLFKRRDTPLDRPVSAVGGTVRLEIRREAAARLVLPRSIRMVRPAVPEV